MPGVFTTKRGIAYHFYISETGSVDLWRRKTIRCTGGYKTKDIPVNPTNEIKEFFKNKYDLEV